MTAIIASSLRREFLTTHDISIVPSQPAAIAPNINTMGFLTSKIKKAMAIPGSAAWEIVSPKRLCFRKRANTPNIPDKIPVILPPIITVHNV